MGEVLSGPISAGVGQSTITPSVGVELAGYGYYLNRKAIGVHDDLFSRALVLEGADGTRLAVISSDLLTLSEEIAEETASLITRRTGIRKENVLLTCTHTHSGPAVGVEEACGEPDPEYLRGLPHAISNSVVQACDNTQEAKLGCGMGRGTALSYNRAQRDGPVDSELGVVRIDGPLGHLNALLFSFSCHSVAIQRSASAHTLISRDWPGYCLDAIEHRLKTPLIFLQGACGDIDPTGSGRTFQFEGAELLGSVLASKVVEVASGTVTSSIRKVCVQKGPLELPLRVMSEEEIDSAVEAEKQKDTWDEGRSRFYRAWPDTMKMKLRTGAYPTVVKAEVALMKIDTETDSVVLVFLPGEVFAGIGIEIKKRIPFEKVVIVGYYGKWIGYVPDPADFDRGGYASTVPPRISGLFPYERNVGELLTEKTLRLFSNLERADAKARC